MFQLEQGEMHSTVGAYKFFPALPQRPHPPLSLAATDSLQLCLPATLPLLMEKLYQPLCLLPYKQREYTVQEIKEQGYRLFWVFAKTITQKTCNLKFKL